MAINYATSAELEQQLGKQFQRLRLAQNIGQASLATAANISLTALKALESGQGSSLRTVVKVARALGKSDWLLEFYPEVEVSPMAVLRASQGIKERKRASRVKDVGK
jgi:transcriptional regulator with XRE-family HTH domain